MSEVVVKQYSLEEEYKKKTGITPEDIKKLRQWLPTQPHLPGDFITDLDLILAYHCTNRSSEVSKQVLDLYFTLKTLFTSFFKDRVVNDNILRSIGYYLFAPLETRAYDGSAIIYCRLLDCDPKNFVLSQAVRLVLMVIDLWQYEEGTWPGLMIIIDLEGVTLSHLARLDLQTLQQLLYYLQEAMLVTIKGIHFLNAPSFMDKLMMLLRPFLKKEMLEVLSIHQVGARTLDKFLPREALPRDSGGHYKSFEEIKNEMTEKITNNSDYFVEENKKRVTEAKRPGKPKTISDIFGSVEGSFKKLDID